MTSMHEGEQEVSAALVHALVTQQFPQWAELPLRRVPSDGTSNAMFRLGEDLVARLPLMEWAVSDVHKEQQWLPVLARQLPVAVPVPVAQGAPGLGYPWPWSVHRWVDGHSLPPFPEPLGEQFARDLAGFVRALRGVDTAGVPGASRGPLVQQEPFTRVQLGALRAQVTSGELSAAEVEVDVDLIEALWDEAVAAPVPTEQPVWVHGDLLPGNVLVRDGVLHGVIDWGALGVGVRHADLLGCWSLLTATERDTFREVLDVDEPTWLRGRAFALSVAVQALPYYWHSNAGMTGMALRVLGEVTADARRQRS